MVHQIIVDNKLSNELSNGYNFLRNDMIVLLNCTKTIMLEETIVFVKERSVTVSFCRNQTIEK